MQNALDSAVLAAVTMEGTPAERRQHGKDVFWNNIVESDLISTENPTLQFLPDGRVVGEATAESSTLVMKVFGRPSMAVTRQAQAIKSGAEQKEILFILDYSSSMVGEFEAVRDAGVNLINQLTNNGVNNNVRLGIVPFAEEVFIRIPGEYAISGTPGVLWENCTVDRLWPWTISDAEPTVDPDSKFGLLDESGVPSPADYTAKCTPYLDNNLITIPLNVNHPATIAALQAMTPHDGTNISLALEIGFQVLSPIPPFDQASPFGGSWEKTIILMSDGRHGADGHGPLGEWSEEQGEINMGLTCDALKSRGVRIITVAYELDDEDGKDDLRNCASDSLHFLEGDEETIGDVFDDVFGLFSDSARLID